MLRPKAKKNKIKKPAPAESKKSAPAESKNEIRATQVTQLPILGCR